MAHDYNTRSKGTVEPEQYGHRLNVKGLLDSARKASEEKRQTFHGNIHADSLTQPDTVKSSKQMTASKQITDFSKHLFKTPPPSYNTSSFRVLFTIPTGYSSLRMPQTLIPPVTTSSSLPVVNEPVTAYSSADDMETGTTSSVHTATSSISTTTSSTTTTAAGGDSGRVALAASSKVRRT